MKHLAIDLGASNGRVLTADAAQGMNPANMEKTAEVFHRFPSHIKMEETGMHWHIEKIFQEIQQGLKMAFNKHGDEITSIGIDSWGVDFTLVDKNGKMLFLPYHYRDKRTDGITEEFFKIIPADRLFALTGVQIMQLNTVFQLFALRRSHPDVFKQAHRYLSVPDLLSYWFTGEMINERSHASTTQIFSPSQESWSNEVLEKLDIPNNIFGEISPSGTVIGSIKEELRNKLKIPSSVKFVASASHDTQSAAFTIGQCPERAFISCGTWSILGTERKKACLTEETFAGEFSNEASAYGGYNLLKNIMGFWILQECKRHWDSEENKCGYDELVRQAEEYNDMKSRIDVNDPLFLKASQQDSPMPKRINQYLKEKEMPLCSNKGAFTRVIVESLADYYAKTTSRLQEITRTELKELHLIGGGAKNKLLCRLTAEKTGLNVIVGASEATAIGNIMIQHKALN